jgi:hypothetical protein
MGRDFYQKFLSQKILDFPRPVGTLWSLRNQAHPPSAGDLTALFPPNEWGAGVMPSGGVNLTDTVNDARF